MEVSKIRLSPSELELVSNAAIILTKNRIIQKAVGVLEILQDEISQDADNFPSAIFSISPKISKGENYLGLPYAILDFPRIAEKENLCFIRSMFWWGNFFSTTLLVTGSFRKRIQENSVEVYESLRPSNYYISISDDPWVHHFEKDNYQPISDFNHQKFKKMMDESPFIKIATKFPLEHWESAAIQLKTNWRKLAALITKPVE
jgi:hypothetical protein